MTCAFTHRELVVKNKKKIFHMAHKVIPLLENQLFALLNWSHLVYFDIAAAAQVLTS